jgi:hypothetical protein
MKISVACTSCGKRYEVDEAYSGKRGKCSTCGHSMTIPGMGKAASPAAESEAYELDQTHDSAHSNAFTPARGGGDNEQPQQERRLRQKTPRRPGRRVGESPTTLRSSARLAALIGLACVAAVLFLLAFLVPGMRMNVGRLIALAGLVLLLYGYGSGAYIAFTEDDLYGWLYLMFPPYAAYYFVSRWDEMRSRMVMLVLGLTLLTGGGRLLETEHPRVAPGEAVNT